MFNTRELLIKSNEYQINENDVLKSCTNDVNKTNFIWEGTEQVFRKIRFEFSTEAASQAGFDF